MKCRICNNEGHNRCYTVKEMMFGTKEEFEYAGYGITVNFDH